MNTDQTREALMTLAATVASRRVEIAAALAKHEAALLDRVAQITQAVTDGK